LTQELTPDADVRRLAFRIQQGGFPATFDADAHLRRPRSELLSIHHPIVRLAQRFMEQSHERLHRAFHLRCSSVPAVRPGQYLLLAVEFSISGARPRVDLTPVFWNVLAGVALAPEDSRQLFIALLDSAQSVDEEPRLSSGALWASIESLKAHVSAVSTELRSREVALQKARDERRRTTQQATLQARVRSAKQRLAGLEDRHAAEFAIRMAHARLQQEESRFAAFKREVTGETPVVIEEREVAV